mmetsp:Transcript_14831/g.30182  ORF Transcript_14831/g.30182 Transcript_14831/m.30182 type:complete len:202 (-) Transcript_14831:428-1033(-)|eukprot:CAMPEP_0184681910 /NCGR_PEP_ID=MMETSP0312-20130426/4892_1 /TAXON_ID=31354 /ORGANISM="Compsopogon coeruleus, Strain SAG 36.94" /LENGTH=201 /DNA_ID=CAMNT_0027133045 /DNA_START=148 /DNA_END=753 /DNA_ORIENTATION=-
MPGDSGTGQAAVEDGGSLRHKLQYSWTLWSDGGVAGRKNQGNWDANMKQVISISTVEEMWAVFNNILEPSQMQPGLNIHLFKTGIAPKWEDPQNTKGGRWIFSSPRTRADRLDEYWINTVMAILGENFDADESEDICGVALSIRKAQDRICIWTKSGTHEDLQVRIGKRWRSLSSMAENIRLDYEVHEDARKELGVKRYSA